MPIQIGQPLPDVQLDTLVDGKVRQVSTAELFRGKKAVLFAVPGAYTSTCSERHLPGYLDLAPDFKRAGVDLVACTAVNDIFVLKAWSEDHEAGDKLVLLADGNGDFARAMGLELDARAFRLGIRSQRYAALVEDGIVKALFTDVPNQVQATGAAAMLALASGQPRS